MFASLIYFCNVRTGRCGGIIVSGAEIDFSLRNVEFLPSNWSGKVTSVSWKRDKLLVRTWQILDLARLCRLKFRGPSGWLRYAACFSNWLKWIQNTELNSKQPVSRQMDVSESTFKNPFQLCPITLLLHLGPHLCPEVCSSRPYMESQETEQWKELH